MVCVALAFLTTVLPLCKLAHQLNYPHSRPSSFHHPPHLACTGQAPTCGTGARYGRLVPPPLLHVVQGACNGRPYSACRVAAGFRRKGQGRRHSVGAGCQVQVTHRGSRRPPEHI
jgi:hypothetical protein